MCLNQVTQPAYPSTKAALERETSAGLLRYSKFLTSGKPRVITRNLGDAWFVYTDASSKWRRVTLWRDLVVVVVVVC